MTVRVLIADDHEIVREGLVALISENEQYQIVAEASDGLEALQMIKKYVPDVVVLDVSMPKMNGIEAARQIKRNFPDIKIVVLSMYDNRNYIFHLLNLEVDAYLLKNKVTVELMAAIEAAIDGNLFLSPKISKQVVREWLRCLSVSMPIGGADELSSRERQVLQLLAEGRTSKEIALFLKLSENTIVTHRQNIMKKLDLRSIAELTKYAIRHGITSLYLEK